MRKRPTILIGIVAVLAVIGAGVLGGDHLLACGRGRN